MRHQFTREKHLRQLLKDNFSAARFCKRMPETLQDPGISKYFKNLATRRFQYALELTEEISYYGGEKPYFSFAGDQTRLGVYVGDELSALKKTRRLYKKSLQRYRLALSQINDGSCRELLIRHKAHLEQCLFELRSMKSLIKYRNQVKIGLIEHLEEK